MEWLRKLLRRDEVSTDKEVLNELRTLKRRLDELAKHNALLVRLDASDKRFMEFTEQTDKNFHDLDTRVVAIERKFPKKKMLDDGRWFKPLETQITEEGGKWAFGAATLVMVFIICFFVFTNHSKEAVDAAAYLLPCCAAIAAGLTVYMEHRKGLLFIVSLFLLFIGIDMFLVHQVDSAETMGYTTALTVGLVDLTLCVLAWRGIAAARASTAEKSIRSKGIWREVRAYFIVLSVAIGSSVYAGFFLVKNYPCFSPNVPAQQCHGVWRWPFPVEH